MALMPFTLLKPELGHRLQSVTSTNSWIRESSIPVGSWVIAEEQTEGKGRKTNRWETLGEDALIFSGKVKLLSPDFALTLFSLFMGKAVLKTIFHFFPEKEQDTTIKWPNDIYSKDKKIGGILIETHFQDHSLEVIIGIGLNLYGSSLPDSLADKATFLLALPLEEGVLERFVNHLVEEINTSIISILDPSQVLKELVWVEEHSLLKNKAIEADWNSKIIRGRVLGIDEQGFLLILTETGEKVELMDTSPNFRII